MSIWAGVIMGYRSNGNCTLCMSPFFFMEAKCQLFTKNRTKYQRLYKTQFLVRCHQEGGKVLVTKNTKNNLQHITQ
jgi:hypothetical protein